MRFGSARRMRSLAVMSYGRAERDIVSRIRKSIGQSASVRRHKIRALLDSFYGMAFVAGERKSTADLLSVSSALARIVGLRSSSFGKLPVCDGLIVVSNHVGIAKLFKVDFASLYRRVHGKCVSIDPGMRHESFVNDDPNILLFYPVIDSIAQLAESRSIFPICVTITHTAKLQVLSEALGFVSLDANGRFLYRELLELVDRAVEGASLRKQFPVVMIFPEGGTSGKLSGGGPYELGKFYTGYYRLARDFGFPVMQVAVQYTRAMHCRVTVGRAKSVSSLSARTHAESVRRWMQRRLPRSK